MDDELQAEVADHLAGVARARRRGAHGAQPAVEWPDRLAEPVGDLDVGALGRARERVALDLVDGELAAEALRDVLDELGEDLARVLGFRPGYECCVPRD